MLDYKYIVAEIDSDGKISAAVRTPFDRPIDAESWLDVNGTGRQFVVPVLKKAEGR